MVSKYLNFPLDFSARFPKAIISIAGLAAIFGGYVYFFELELITDRQQLVDQHLQGNKNYRKFRQEFGKPDWLVLVIKADSATLKHRTAMKRIAQKWASEIRAKPELFSDVIAPIKWSQFGDAGILYLPYDKLEQLRLRSHKYSKRLQKLAQSPTLQNSLAAINRGFHELGAGKNSMKNDDAQLFVKILKSMLQYINEELEAQETGDRKKWKNDIDLLWLLSDGRYDEDGYVFSDSGKILTVYASAKGNSTQRNRFAKSVRFAKQALDIALANVHETELRAGIAGMPALESEEIETSQKDFARSGVIALTLITLLFILAFGSFSRAVLAALCLCMAIAMTFAFTWLVVGHLNVLAMIFTVILVALGVDFGIHFLTHYEKALVQRKSAGEALAETNRSIGAALWMSGTTTAAAFLSAYFTEFDGLAELGLIAGGGLILCFLCMILVYPAMLYLLDKSRNVNSFHPKRSRTTFQTLIKFVGYNMGSSRKKRIVFLFIIAVGLGFAFGQYDIDTNLLKLQAVDSDANFWQKVLIESEDRSLFAVSSFRDPDSLKKNQAAFINHRDVFRTAQSLYPTRESEKRRILSQLCTDFSGISVAANQESEIFGLKRETWNLRNRVRKYRNADSKARTALAPIETELNRFYTKLQEKTPRVSGNIGKIDHYFQTETKSILTKIQHIVCDPAFIPAKLPSAFRKQFIGDQGTLALYVYPTENIWEQDNLKQFIDSARKIDPNISGEIISLYDNGQSLIRSFVQAGVYSLVVISLLILLWSKSVKWTLLAMVPLFASLGLLLGFMNWWPATLKWNFTNFFAIPILIGIGVDSGIHLVQGWKSGDRETFNGAIRAVTLSTVTTMIGFGVLATSKHQGVASFGFVLLVGMFFCLVASLTLAPALLSSFANKTDNI